MRQPLQPVRFPAGDQPPRVSLLSEGVPPFAPVFIGADYRLHISIWNSVLNADVELNLQILRKGGNVTVLQQKLVPTSDRLVSSFVVELGPEEGGILLSVVAIPGALPFRRGEMYVMGRLLRGQPGTGAIIQVLFAGYCTEHYWPCWPQGTLEPPTSGRGVLRIVGGANPAAGVEISETVPTNARWKLVAVRFTFVTAVAVANRQVGLLIDDGATTPFVFFAATLQGASTTNVYQVAVMGDRLADVLTERFIPIPPDLHLFQGWRIRTNTVNLQAADDYSAPTMIVEEWIED